MMNLIKYYAAKWNAEVTKSAPRIQSVLNKRTEKNANKGIAKRLNKKK